MDHALLGLIDQICESLDKKAFFRNFCWFIKNLWYYRSWDTRKKNQKSMEYVVSICHGLKVIFQTKSNVLNIKMISTGRNPQNYYK